MKGTKFIALVAAIVAIVSTSSLKAEEKIIEIYGGYGFAPIVSLPDIGVKERFSGGVYTASHKEITGSINVGARYYVSPKFAVGLDYSHLNAERTLVVGSSIPLGTLKNSIDAIMFSGKYDWLSIRNFTFYSQAGIGVMIFGKGKLTDALNNVAENLEPALKSKKKLAWQAMPIGIEYSPIKHLAIFAEGGAGTSGCCILGAKVSF